VVAVSKKPPKDSPHKKLRPDIGTAYRVIMEATGHTKKMDE